MMLAAHVVISPQTIALLGLAAGMAGLIDSIAGGGGLITTPALLAAGLPPLNALATNKLQSVFSQMMSTWRYAGRGLIDFRGYVPTALAIFCASAVGTLTVQHVATGTLRRLIPLLVIAAMLYMLLSPRMTDAESAPRVGRVGYAPVATAIGFYDGFFGPGTGSFFTTSLVGLRGMGVIRAAAHTKLFNFASNAGSLTIFLLSGQAIWLIGFTMAVCAMAGAWIGAHVAMRHGARVIRPLLIAASLALTAKLIWDGFFAGR